MQANTNTVIQSGVTATDVGPRLSADGRLVAFTTTQSLLPADTIALSSDIYVRDLQKGTVALVSGGANGVPLAGVDSGVSLSSDGQWAAFQSNNGTLVSVLLKNLSSGALVNISTSAAGVEGNNHSYNAVIAGNGSQVAFLSKATNLTATDSNGQDDVFVKNVQTGAIVNASTTGANVQANAPSSEAAISNDGRYVAFTSYASNLVANDNSNADIFVKDLQTGNLIRVSSDAAGNGGNGNSDHAAFSANGRYVVFASSASNLVADDTNGQRDVFRKDLVTGQVVRVSTTGDGLQGLGDSGNASVSADGRYVAFSSTSSLTAGDGDGKADIFIKDVLTGALTRISPAAAADQFHSLEANALSANGLQVIYNSYTFANGTVGGRDLVLGQVGAGFGSATPETFNGTAGNDVTLGNQGRDTFNASAGNDTIDGGGGVDTAVYGGARAAYTINTTTAGTVVTGPDGTDTLANVERLHFANADLALDINGNAGAAYRLYQAAFNRTPDAGGLGFWIKALDNGLSQFEAAGFFLGSAEAKALYGANASNSTVLDLFYENVLHRDPDASGLAYWQNVLDTGAATQAQVLAFFAASPENQAGVIGSIQNGISYTPYLA